MHTKIRKLTATLLRMMSALAAIAVLAAGPQASAAVPAKPARSDVAVAHDAEDKWLLYEVWHDQKLLAYLFGAIHHPIGDVKVPGKVFSALEKSASLQLESNFFDPQLATDTQRMLTSNPDGKMLSDVLLPQTVQTLDELFTFHKFPPASRASINNWTPFMAVMTMTMPCTRVSAAGAAPERVIFEFAKLAKLRIGEGLEGPQEQFGRLTSLSKDQWQSYVQAHVAWVKDLRCGERFADSTRKIWKYMLQGDADAMYDEYMRFHTEVVPTAWFQRDYFLSVRNRPMVEKMLTMTDSDLPTFFSVGALHLGGPEGIVSILRQKGYRLVQR